MGKYRPFILLGTAVIIALITSLLIYGVLQRKTGAKEMVLETQPVATAAVDLSWGTVLTKEMIKMEPYLKRSLPGGAITEPSLLSGRVLISPVKAREPVLESRLAPSSIKTGGVSAVISPNKRAVAVKVDKVIGVAGFIQPGNRVDVLVTITMGKISTPITKTVLENIPVLAAGPEMQVKGKEEKPSPVDVITLEVSPQDAEKLALAATEGKIQLALRSFTDTEEVLTQGQTISTLLASYSGQNSVKTRVASQKGPLTRKPSAKEPSIMIVELIKGGKVSTMKFEGGK